MVWKKDTNNKWFIADNDISYATFKDNLKNSDTLNIIRSDDNKPVIYLPTHNIHDVYEWFRIFKDSHLVSDNLDKYGFAIHGFFNKKRSESIQGYFPNLIEVKATSTEELKYYNDGSDYFRTSNDYIADTNITFSELEIDGVEILNEENILLKHQYTENIDLLDIIVFNSNYYIDVDSSLAIRLQKLKIGNSCIIKYDTNQFAEDTILNLEFVTEDIGFGVNDYVIIKFNNTYSNIISCADFVLGDWLIADDQRDIQGVYQFFNNKLYYLEEMNNKYKTYNQIVYTYQGVTNQNKEFYLRRVEDVTDTANYSTYPFSSLGLPMIYSEGEAYLIKCKLEYTLDTELPQHPAGSPPYGPDTDAYKLLFLDHSQATKILGVDQYGVGKYAINSPIILGNFDTNYDVLSTTTFNMNFNSSVTAELTGKTVTSFGSNTLSSSALPLGYVSAPTSLNINPLVASSTFNTNLFNTTFGTLGNPTFVDQYGHTITAIGNVTTSTLQFVSTPSSAKFDTSSLEFQDKIFLQFTGPNGSSVFTDSTGINTITRIGNAEIQNNKLYMPSPPSAIFWPYSSNFDLSVNFKMSFELTVNNFVNMIPLFAKTATAAPSPVGVDFALYLVNMNTVEIFGPDDLTKLLTVVLSTSPLGQPLVLGNRYKFEIFQDTANNFDFYINGFLIFSSPVTITNSFVTPLYIGRSDGTGSGSSYYSNSQYFIDDFKIEKLSTPLNFPYIEIINAAPQISFANNFEIKFSFRYESGVGVGSVINLFSKDSGANKFLMYLQNNTNFHLEIGANTININLLAAFGSNLSPNTWYNVTFTALNGTNTLKLNATTLTTNSWSIPNTSANLILGNNAGFNDTVWYMDNLTIGAEIYNFTSSYLKIANNIDIDFSLDFTLEFNFNINTFVDSIVFFNKSNNALNIYDLKIKLFDMNNLHIFLNQNSSPSIIVPYAFTVNNWFNVKIIKQLGVIKIEINNVDQGFSVSTAINNNSSYDIFININDTVALNSSQSNFYLDDIKLVKHLFAFDPHQLTFDNVDVYNNPNTLDEYEKDIFFGAPILPNYTFKHRPLLDTNQTYIKSFTGSTGVTITQLASTTRIKGTYAGNPKFRINDPSPTAESVNTFNIGDFVNIKIEFNSDGVFYTALEEQFIINTVTQLDATAVEMSVFPKFDTNFMLEYASFISGTNLVRMTIECVNVYGDLITNYVIDPQISAKKLIDSLNKTILAKIYNLSYSINNTTGDYILDLNNIKQNHKWKWSNHSNLILTTEIEPDPMNPGSFITTNTNYEYNHVLDIDILKYFYNYDIVDYLTNYLDVSTLYIAQNEPISFTYLNTLNNDNRIGVEGANRAGTTGNIIYFGLNYMELVLDNVKPSTLVKFENTTTSYTKNITVKSVEWNDELQLGTITTLSDITIPSTGDNIELSFINDLATIETYLKSIFNKKINIKGDPSINDFSYLTHPDFKPDTASYAYGLLNYGKTSNVGLTKNTGVLDQVTGIVYKEYNEPKISFLKRDKYFDFNNNIIECAVQSAVNINLASAPGTINAVVLTIGDLIIIAAQTVNTQNGIYVYQGTGSALIRYIPFNKNIFWQNIANGNIVKAIYTDPLIYGTTVITFSAATTPNLKRDNRLTLRPIEIAKLGVDNKTQPWQKIYYKYDSLELEENKVDITIGINNRRRIRFIDGLTQNNIINNIGGQGQYAWILNDDVIVDDAVVGCTQTNGPGTGTLIWYKGTWENGVWVDGIWIQGDWKNGIWLNGTFNTYTIQDFYSYVTVNYSSENIILSTWESGTWVNGTFNNGTAVTINWLNGIFNNGLIKSGTWQNGTFTNGVINYIEWFDGTFNGGDFETGVWHTGTLNQIDGQYPARFGTKSLSNGIFKDRAIWYSGIFIGGEFHAGVTNSVHNSSIWYTGTFESGQFYGGSFISGSFNNSIWYDGVFFGGYYITSFNDLTGSDKELIIDPTQYETKLFDGTTLADSDYQANTAHNLDKYVKQFYLFGTPSVITTFSWNAFLNIWHDIVATNYSKKQYVNNSSTDTKLVLSIDSNPADIVYITENISSNIPTGNPFISATFTNSTWKRGLFLNGYFEDSVWETGSFINGFVNNTSFGINSYSV